MLHLTKNISQMYRVPVTVKASTHHKCGACWYLILVNHSTSLTSVKVALSALKLSKGSGGLIIHLRPQRMYCLDVDSYIKTSKSW